MPYNPYSEPFNSPRHPAYPRVKGWSPPPPRLVDAQIPPKGYAPNPFAPFRDIVRPPIGGALAPAASTAVRTGGTLSRVASGAARFSPLAVVLVPAIIGGVLESYAPAVQSWLKRGWKGQTGYGIADTLEMGTIAPGSRAVLYKVDTEHANGNNATCSTPAGTTGTRNATGPITTRTDYVGLTSGACTPASQTRNSKKVLDGAGNTLASAFLIAPAGLGFLVYTATPLDGVTEGVPSPSAPPQITPSPLIQNPKEGQSPYSPDPQRQRDPRTTSPYRPPTPQNSPLGSPDTRAGNQPLLPPVTSPDPSQAPLPAPGTPPANNPDPIDYPEPTAADEPAQRPPTASEQCQDPCAIRMAEGIDAIKEKLEEAFKKGEEEDPNNCPVIPDISFPLVTGSCEDGKPKIKMWTLRLREAPPQGLREALDAMASLAAEACQKDSIVSFPDWWNCRVGADRPQIVIVYRSGNTSAYHSLSLPWPASNVKWETNLLGDYQAGAVHGSLVLKDNSKFIVNCSTEAEARRMIAKARTLINPAMQDASSTVHISKKDGRTIIERPRYGRNASYYPSGQLEFSPEWKAVFRD